MLPATANIPLTFAPYSPDFAFSWRINTTELLECMRQQTQEITPKYDIFDMPTTQTMTTAPATLHRPPHIPPLDPTITITPLLSLAPPPPRIDLAALKASIQAMCFPPMTFPPNRTTTTPTTNDTTTTPSLYRPHHKPLDPPTNIKTLPSLAPPPPRIDFAELKASIRAMTLSDTFPTHCSTCDTTTTTPHPNDTDSDPATNDILETSKPPNIPDNQHANYPPTLPKQPKTHWIHDTFTPVFQAIDHLAAAIDNLSASITAAFPCKLNIPDPTAILQCKPTLF